MSVLERPGINPIWAKTRKSDYSPRQMELTSDNVDSGRKRIEHYCLHGEVTPSSLMPPRLALYTITCIKAGGVF
jgi:hypothetical protein